MLTPLGKFLRKLRVDHDETLKDMAAKLEVSASFLSAVENHKKMMPSYWNKRICVQYDLNELQEEEWTAAIAETCEGIMMNLSRAEPRQRELAVLFARTFGRLTNEQVDEIWKILQNN